MTALRLTFGDVSSPFRILAIGCHADDIEIGCGGTILRLIETIPQVEVCWVVLSAHGDRADEVHASADAFLAGTGQRQVMVQDYRDGFLPYSGGSVKQFFEDLKSANEPDLIFTHYRGDLHQDHRLASELTWNTFRDHLILEYEVPKYDGDLGTPNVFVHLDETHVKRKVEYLLSYFQTQRNRAWFTEDLFLSILRLRGMESTAPHRYAEGFYGRKIRL